MVGKKPAEFINPVLRGQKKTFAEFLDAIPWVTLAIDPEGDVLHLNPAARKFFKPVINDREVLNFPNCSNKQGSSTWETTTTNGKTSFDFDIFPFTIDGEEVITLILSGTRQPKNLHHLSQELFSSLFEETNEGIVVGDHNLVIFEWNKGMERITGYSMEEAIGLTLGELLAKISPNPYDPILDTDITNGHLSELMHMLMGEQKTHYMETRIRDKHGEIRTVQYHMFPVFLDGKVFPGATVHDITEVKQAEETLRASEVQFRTLVEAMGEGAVSIDLDWNILFSNPVADMMYGGGPGFLLGKNIHDFISPQIEPFLKKQVQRIKQGLSNSYDLEILDFHGHVHTIHVISSPWRGAENDIKGSILVFNDITEQIKAVEKLRFSSTHDEFTQLYNRNYYEEEIARLKAGRRFPVSIVIVDMDELKSVNDSLGHSAGDLMLKNFGAIAHRVFRGDDVVARIGGDEFAVLLPETERQTAHAIVDRLKEAVVLHNAANPEQKVLFSVGTATAKSADELEDAIRRADNRMYREKRQKKKPV
jgi:diguanylate cyclase (GGDEF)-like protein/PAS domain S-box-containing protein